MQEVEVLSPRQFAKLTRMTFLVSVALGIMITVSALNHLAGVSVFMLIVGIWPLSLTITGMLLGIGLVSGFIGVILMMLLVAYAEHRAFRKAGVAPPPEA